MKTKPKYNIFQNIAWMVGIAWKTEKSTLLLCVAAAAADVIYRLVQLYAAPQILSAVEQGKLHSLLVTIALFTAGLFLMSGINSYLEEIQAVPGVDVRKEIITRITMKAMKTSYPNTLEPQFKKLLEKSSEASCSNLSPTEHIWVTLCAILKNLGGFVVCLTILSHVNGVLILITILTCAVSFMVSLRADNWCFAHRDEENTLYTKINYIGVTSTSTVLAKDIRIFGLQPWLEDILDSVYRAFWDYRLRCEKANLAADMTEAVLTVARNGIAYVYLISMTLRDGLSVSEFLLYFTAISSFTTWIMGILRECMTLHTESLDISQVRSFIDYPEPFRFEGGKPLPQTQPCELKLENVSYRYPGAEKDTIHGMNLTVAAGERLAIVGLNGAGKTTLVKLLSGLLDPTEGRMLLNGQDIREFNREEYYTLFSAVFQEFSVWDVTVAEQVAQACKNIDEARVWSCLEQAGLKEYVASLPSGLQTHIGRKVYEDGVMLSGGQLQRLMLARALYKNGAVLLLDEPTAALDPLAENDIYLRYHEMTAGKTALFISHRLASTRFCDRIVFLADGTIAEEGTHEGLLSAGGEYAKLFEIQSRYYQEGRDF